MLFKNNVAPPSLREAGEAPLAIDINTMRIATHSTKAALLITAALLAACVPNRKYEEEKARAISAQAEAEAAMARARDSETALTELRAGHDDLKKRVARLEQDTSVMGTSLRKMSSQYDKINALNNELLEKYNKLLAGSGSENRKLLSDLEALRLDLMNREDSVSAMARRVNDKQAALTAREAELAALQAELAAKDAAMKALKDRVSAALTGFEGKGLTVVQKDGRVYVSMENKLLFPSGSYAVDAKGKELIMKLAKAIENEKELNVLVEGHTDTDKVLGGGALKDNWDLSVMRATSVVRIMQESSKLDPVRVTAAGRSEYIPVEAADKAKNRRIEIILAPDLQELMKLVKD